VTRAPLALACAALAAGSLVTLGAPAGAVQPTGVRVAVVIDFGTGATVRPRVVTRCIRVPTGSNGSDVLATLASDERVPAPSYAPSGLLCTIDGFPAAGCGAAPAGAYAYWSYWHGGRTWTYADVGPAGFAVTTSDVEGWRYQPGGSGSASDPAPRFSPSFAAVCANAAVLPTGLPAVPGGATPWVPIAVAGCVLALALLSVRRWRRSPT